MLINARQSFIDNTRLNLYDYTCQYLFASFMKKSLLELIRDRTGLNQSDFARAIGWSRQRYGMHLKQGCELSASKLKTIIKSLGSKLTAKDKEYILSRLLD